MRPAILCASEAISGSGIIRSLSRPPFSHQEESADQPHILWTAHPIASVPSVARVARPLSCFGASLPRIVESTAHSGQTKQELLQHERMIRVHMSRESTKSSPLTLSTDSPCWLDRCVPVETLTQQGDEPSPSGFPDGDSRDDACLGAAPINHIQVPKENAWHRTNSGGPRAASILSSDLEETGGDPLFSEIKIPFLKSVKPQPVCASLPPHPSRLRYLSPVPCRPLRMRTLRTSPPPRAFSPQSPPPPAERAPFR